MFKRLSLLISLLFFFLSAVYFLLSGNSPRSLAYQLDSQILRHVSLAFKPARLTTNVPISIVEINDKDLDAHGVWPWSRAQLATLIERIADQQPAVIGMAVLINPDLPFGEDDQLLVKSIKQSPSFVAGFNFRFVDRFDSSPERHEWIKQASFYETADTQNGSQAKHQTAGNHMIQFPHRMPSGFIPPAKHVAEIADGLGYLENYSPRPNLLDYSTVLHFDNRFYRSYPLALALSYLKQKNGKEPQVSLKLTPIGLKAIHFNDQKLSTFTDGNFLLHYYKDERRFGGKPFPIYSASLLLDEKLPAHTLKDKIVLIDVTASLYGKRLQTPYFKRTATRPEIHATAVANILQGDNVKINSLTKGLEFLLIMLMVIAGSWAARGLRPLVAFLAAFVVFPILLLQFNLLALSFANAWLMITIPAMALLTSFAGHFSHKHFTEDMTRRIVERALKGYTSKTVMNKLIERGENFLTAAGERQELTIMMFDIIGFTKLSQQLTPEEIFTLLNRIFDISDAVIIDEYHGMIDKKMGDACMAIFGLDGHADHPQRAVQAALTIQKRMQDHQAVLQALSHKDHNVELRIGLSLGMVCLGNVGSAKHFNFTAIGEVVNRCQRLEAACKPGGVLISDDLYKQLAGQIDATKVEVQGKHIGEHYLAYDVQALNNNDDG